MIGPPPITTDRSETNGLLVMSRLLRALPRDEYRDEATVQTQANMLASLAPFKAELHGSLMCWLIRTYSSVTFDISVVCRSVRKFAALNLAREQPYDVEDAVQLWFNKVAGLINGLADEGLDRPERCRVLLMPVGDIFRTFWDKKTDFSHVTQNAMENVKK